MKLTAEELTAYLVDELGLDAGDLEPTAPLFSSGVIDSFALVSMIVFIESHCGIKVEPMEVSLDNMDSIERILAFVERKTA